MNNPAYWLTFIASLTLVSCTTVLNNIPGVYRIDIEQGNMIDQGMVDQLRPGMNKRQVLFIMGSPMLADSFHEKRWDYLYSKEPGGEDRVQKRITLFFDGDALVGVQGDLHPSRLPVVKESTETSVDLPKREFDKSMAEALGGLFGMEEDMPKTTKAAKPQPQVAQPEVSFWDSFIGIFGVKPDGATTAPAPQPKPAPVPEPDPKNEKSFWESIGGIFGL